MLYDCQTSCSSLFQKKINVNVKLILTLIPLVSGRNDYQNFVVMPWEVQDVFLLVSVVEVRAE